MSMTLHELLDFILNSLLQHALGSLTEQLLKTQLPLGRGRGLRLDRNCVALAHVCILFCPGGGGFSHPQDAHVSLFFIHNFRSYLRHEIHRLQLTLLTDSTADKTSPTLAP